MINKEELTKLAEDHWNYTKDIITKTLGTIHSNDPELQMLIEKFKLDWIDLCHYLYVAAFIHGWKHREEEGIE